MRVRISLCSRGHNTIFGENVFSILQVLIGVSPHVQQWSAAMRGERSATMPVLMLFAR